MNNQYDAWNAAGTEYVSKREYYGRILVDCVAMVFPGAKGSGQKPVPYDPTVHTNARPFTQISLQLDPLPEMNLSYPIERNLSNFDQDWNKITMPSIRQVGFVTADGKCDLRKFDKSYVKFEVIPGFRKNKDPQKENYTTIKFTGAYKSEAECRKAYLEENGADAELGPVTPTEQTDNSTAMSFVKAVIKESRATGNDVGGILDDVKKFISDNKEVCGGLSITSPEVIDAINEPPF